MSDPHVLERRVIYTGSVFDVEQERVVLPSGVTATIDVVRHSGSVVLLPMPDEHHLVLVRQYRAAVGQWLWELPAGRVERNEHPEDAARRECEEETGFLVGRVEALGSYFPSPGFCDEKMMFYRLTGLSTPSPDREPAKRDEDEDIEVRVFSVEDVRGMLARGEIVDMKTALGLTVMT